MRLRRFFCAIAALLLWMQAGFARGAETASGSEAASFSLPSNSVPLTSLDGEWRFHPGDDAEGRLGWAKPGLDDSGWMLLRSDAPWSSQGLEHAGLENLTGYGWYRFRVTVADGRRGWAILLPPFSTGYEVFVDGVRVGSEGSYRHRPIPLLRVAVVNSNVYLLPRATGDDGARGHTYQIALRVWAEPSIARYYYAGPANGSGVVGTAKTLQSMLTRQRVQELYFYTDNFAFALQAAVIAIFSLGLYWFRRGDKEYLWFGLIPVFLGLDALLSIVFVVRLQALPLWDLVDSVLEVGYQISLLVFVSRVLGTPLSVLRKALVAVGALSILTVPLYWMEVVSAPIAGWIGILMVLPIMVWVLWKLSMKSARGNVTARLMLLPVLLINGLSLLDDVTLTLNQFHLIREAEPFEQAIPMIGFHMHPMIVARTLFLLAMMGFLIDRFTHARRREERMVASMEAARQVQRLLLPEVMPQVPGLELECAYHPAEMVGGDFFLPIPTGQGGLILLLGDVSGKGLPASMLVAMLVGAARAEIAITSDPVSILEGLNATLRAHRTGHFATCLVCHIAADGTTKLASAGHPSPYRNGVEVEMPGALPLGIAEETDCENCEIALDPGDRLVLISDGVLEAQDTQGNLLGFEAAARAAALSAHAIAAAAIAHGQEDDITVLALTRLAAV